VKTAAIPGLPIVSEENTICPARVVQQEFPTEKHADKIGNLTRWWKLDSTNLHHKRNRVLGGSLVRVELINSGVQTSA
jgi:hypothetical protein